VGNEEKEGGGWGEGTGHSESCKNWEVKGSWDEWVVGKIYRHKDLLFLWLRVRELLTCCISFKYHFNKSPM